MKSKSLLWCDLTPEHVESLHNATTRPERELVLASIFDLHDYKENSKSSILMELYFQTINFAFKSDFTTAKVSTFFSIVKLMHFHAISTPGISLETLFNLFKSLLVNHSVPRPPYSVLIFSLPDVQNITNYVTNTYFRHLKLYLYTFTKKRVLHIHNGSTNVETPPPFPSLSIASLLPPPTTMDSSSASVNNNEPNMVSSSSSEPSNETPLEQGRAASRTSVSQDQPLAPSPSPSPSLSLSEALESHQQLSLSNVIANELSKEVQALASTSVNMQFDKLKSEFEKKMKQHEQVLMEKLELLETKSKKGKPK